MDQSSTVRSTSESSRRRKSLRISRANAAHLTQLAIAYGCEPSQGGSQLMPKRPTTSSSKSSRATPKTTAKPSGTLTQRLPKQLASLRQQDIPRREFIHKLSAWLGRNFGAQPVANLHWSGRAWTKSWRCQYDPPTKEVAILTISFTCPPYSAEASRGSQS